METFPLPPALVSYYSRIGAHVVNFRRAMIRHHRGRYYVEKTLILVKDDGSLSVTGTEGDAAKPTEEEAEAIRLAVLATEWPKSILASLPAAEEFARSLSGKSFLFWSRSGGGVSMVQERRTGDDGSRDFLPHCLFSDGRWRQMEPDGKLPLWKPREARSDRIMIHEGAKAAMAAEAVCGDADSPHPWAEELRMYEHWGMIGGALAPHRSDYDEIHRERPTEVVYVCDNDWAGKTALQKVSKCYGRSLKGVVFDERWPASWDLADPIPEGMFHEGRFNGPSLRSLLRPATHATELFRTGEKGKPGYVLRQEFAEEWFHTVIPEGYVHRDWPSEVLTLGEFNNRVRPFSAVDDTARLVKGCEASKALLLKYSPVLPSGITADEDGRTCLNTHVGTHVKEESGSPAPFLDFMQHLIPSDEDRMNLSRWVATLIARPEIKMLYGVLLISENQGVGKGTLGEKVLAPLVGRVNTSMPSEAEIVESDFNYWAAHKRLAVVHEIYAGHSSKAYNKLKSMITDGYININKKYQATYVVDNWIHILGCSNSKRALKLSIDDRRWFVPKVTEERKPERFWRDFNNWLNLEGGLGIIKRWAREFTEEPDMVVLRGETAPWSDAKREMIEDGWSDGMNLVAKILAAFKEEADQENKTIILLDTELVKVIKNVIHEGRSSDKLERPATVRKVAQAVGWHVGEEKIQSWRWGSVESRYSRVISNDFQTANTRPAELMERTKPLNVEEMVRKVTF